MYFLLITLGIVAGVAGDQLYRRYEKIAWKYAVSNATNTASTAFSKASAIKTVIVEHIAALEKFVAEFDAKIAESPAKAKAEIEAIIAKAKKI